MRDCPQPLRRIRYHDVQTSKTFNFLTNNFAVPAQTVADLYRYHWQVELFFKWIKQHLEARSAQPDCVGDHVGVGCVKTLALTRQTISELLCVATQHIRSSKQCEIIQDRT